MKNKLFLLTIVVIVVGIFLFLLQNQKPGSLVSSSLSKTGSAAEVIISPTPMPSSIPKTFKFDSSTDLKKELDSINPQVLDSDFE